MCVFLSSLKSSVSLNSFVSQSRHQQGFLSEVKDISKKLQTKMANATQFIGSKISLISKSEIRYEGVLYALDVKDSTISLAKVSAFGTESRPTERPVAPRDDIYDFIVFRGSDIKCIDVVEPPRQSTSETEGISNDPAILEVSQHNSRSQGSSFPRFGGGSSGSNHQQQQRQKENVLEGLLRRGPRQGTNTDGQDRRSGRSNKTTSTGEQQDRSEGDRDGRNRGGRGQGQGRGGGRRDLFQEFRGGNRDFSFSPRGGGWGGRPGYRRPQGILRAPQTPKVTFEQDFDFEKSNEELLTKLKDVDVKVEALDEGQMSTVAEVPVVDAENQENKEPQIFYKKDDFFDAISCEALERAKGPMTRPDWRVEVKLNAETFGLSGQRRGGFYRGGRGGFYSGRYDGRWSYNGPRGFYNDNWY